MDTFHEPLTDGAEAALSRNRSRLSAMHRRQRWAVLGVVALLLAAVAVPQAFRHVTARPTDDGLGGAAPRQPSRSGEFRGITLQLHSYDAAIPFETYVEEIAKTGANTICFSLAGYQENASSSSIFIEYRKVPSVERLAKLIDLAHQRGLRVVVMPIILLERAGSGEWRGKIRPTDVNAWWEDYENFVLFYANAAARSDAEVLMVGSELVSMEDQTDRWRGLIKKVRGVYKGRLSYSANWDHYENIEWWSALDLVGMTVYYDLVGENKPSLDVLVKAWQPIRKKVLAWQKTVDRPIMFTEVGWPSQVGCAKEPWNYYGSKVPDPVTQDLCFKAFFQTWYQQPAVAGWQIWEWRNHPKQLGGPEDTSYIPNGKPALNTIMQYFDGNDPPTSAPAEKDKPPAATAPKENP